ncbi:class I SAM-dependent methyltransferase [Hymenobacter sp. RP-2-7]|uniref:Class I SAM-dependent methyltransferase n=1 Tax=Hymenobacter polaris TaxID=2682546 RepID=A0A7Y0FNW8_9BACT|nr:class I SAM-dependent methyltransferase [Hymenobacter polaris]NML67021.1 class I SAM-dependent methyltransferase [Hymenobacter polaris]
MDLSYEAKYHQLEERHWWFAGRRDAVFDIIQGLKLPSEAAILEIGCSGGPLLQRLRASGYTDVTGVDVSTAAIELAQARGVPNVTVMDGAALAFSSSSFDLVIASDVLEHIENESRALQEWVRVLQPGGQLLVFVPAHNYLWSAHDVVNHHFRRYSRLSLVRGLAAAGLRVQRSSFWNVALYFPVALVRLVARLLRGRPTTTSLAGTTGDLRQLPGLANYTLLSWIRLENWLLRRIDMPLGVSVFALAQKPFS